MKKYTNILPFKINFYFYCEIFSKIGELQEFDSSRDADDAIYDLNGKDLAGERVILELSRRGPRMRDDFDRGGRGTQSR